MNIEIFIKNVAITDNKAYIWMNHVHILISGVYMHLGLIIAKEKNFMVYSVLQN